MEFGNPINDLIKSLLDSETAFPPRLLYQFSNLSPDDLHVLGAAWPTIPVERRKNLLMDLTELGEKDHLLMFEDVGKIGLQDGDSEVVTAAIDLLFEAEDKSLIPTFLKLLGDQTRSEQVRAAAANALGPYVYLGELDKLRPEVQEGIESGLLAAHTSDPSDLVRRRALESLGYSGSDEIAALLRLACARDNEEWLESALFAMGRSADEQWEQTILENLDNKNSAVCVQAVHAAGELSLTRARSRLLRKIDHEPNEDVRHEIIWALSQIGGEEVESKLESLLESAGSDEEAQIIEDALDALNFTNGNESFDLMDVPIESTRSHEGHHHEENDEDRSYEDEDANADEDFDDEENEEGENRMQRYNSEWERYVGEDEDEDAEDDEYDDEDEDER